MDGFKGNILSGKPWGFYHQLWRCSAWNFPITQFWGPVVSQIQLLRHDLGSTSNPYPIGSMYAIYANIGGILMVNITIYSIHGSYGYVEGFNWQLLNSKLSVPKILGGPTIINYPAGESFFGGWKREVRAVKPESSTTQLHHIIAEIQPTPDQVTRWPK